jgi:acyl-CoA thioesterase-1
MKSIVGSIVLLLGVFAALADAAGTQVRVTCIGDSITSGGGCGIPSYVETLEALLGEDYSVTNAGCSGMTQLKTGQCNGGGDCSYWKTNEWQLALNSKPDIVVIMLGTNDAKAFNWEGVQQNTGDYFALDYVDMINKVKATNTKEPEIYAMIPPPLYEPFPFEMNSTVINQVYPNLIRNIATVTGVKVIDIYSAFVGWDVDSSEKTCDGCHPSADGAYLIADTVAAAIQESSKFSKRSHEMKKLRKEKRNH